MFKKLRARKEFRVMSKRFYSMVEGGISVYTLEREVKRMEYALQTRQIFEGQVQEFKAQMDVIKAIPNKILRSYLDII